jgi:hypothetical protein
MAKLTLTQMAERVARLESRVRDLEDELALVQKRLPRQAPRRVPFCSMLSYELGKKALAQLGRGHTMSPAPKKGAFTVYKLA